MSFHRERQTRPLLSSDGHYLQGEPGQPLSYAQKRGLTCTNSGKTSSLSVMLSKIVARTMSFAEHSIGSCCWLFAPQFSQGVLTYECLDNIDYVVWTWVMLYKPQLASWVLHSAGRCATLDISMYCLPFNLAKVTKEMDILTFRQCASQFTDSGNASHISTSPVV